MKESPSARNCTTVTMTFMDVSNDDVMMKTIAINQTVCPWVAITESGG